MNVNELYYSTLQVFCFILDDSFSLTKEFDSLHDSRKPANSKNSQIIDSPRTSKLLIEDKHINAYS